MNADLVLTECNEYGSVCAPLNIERNAVMQLIKKISSKTLVGSVNAKMLPEDGSSN